MKKPGAVKRSAAQVAAARKWAAAGRAARVKKHAKATAAQHAATLKWAAAGRAAMVRAARTGRPAPVRRQLALGDGVACCAAEALAASLRLTGRPVSDADVLALYRRTADDPDAGASILATLEAAREYGLAGVRLAQFGLHAQSALDRFAEGEQRLGHLAQAIDDPAQIDVHTRQDNALILGLDLPGPHAVLATPDGWWSWGELYDPACWPDAVIEEAWAVTWG